MKRLALVTSIIILCLFFGSSLFSVLFVHGFVYTRSDRPINKAYVELIGTNGELMEFCYTDSTGYYSFRAVPPIFKGKYSIRIRNHTKISYYPNGKRLPYKIDLLVSPDKKSVEYTEKIRNTHISKNTPY